MVLRTSGGDLAADRVIYATGRSPVPNAQGIGLEELGVRLGEVGAVLVDRDYGSSTEGVFAVGDCSDHGGHGLASGQFDLTPVAIAEGRAWPSACSATTRATSPTRPSRPR